MSRTDSVLQPTFRYWLRSLTALCAADDEACSGETIYLPEHAHQAKRLAQSFAAMAADSK